MLESHVSRRVFEFLQVLFPLPRTSKEHILFSADLGQLLLSIRHEWCQKKQKSHRPHNGETCMLEPHVSRGVFEFLQVLFPLSRASKEHILLFPAGFCCCHLFYIRCYNHTRSISSTCTIFWSMNLILFHFLHFCFPQICVADTSSIRCCIPRQFRVFVNKYVQSAVNWRLKFMLYTTHRLHNCMIFSSALMRAITGCMGDIVLLKCWEIEGLTTTWVFLYCDCVGSHYLSKYCSEK